MARWLVSLVGVGTLTSGAFASLQVIDLGPGQAFGLNDVGSAVGRTAANKAFTWQGGLRSELSPPDSFAGRGFDINNQGDLVGTVNTFSRPQGEPFLRIEEQFTFVAPGGAPGQANALNDNRQVVGQYDDLRGFVWNDGNAADIGTFGGTRSAASDINASGQVVGFAARANTDTSAFLITPEDTNNDGLADLWFRDSNNDQVNDLMMDLGTLGGPSSVATGINDTAGVVGFSDTGSSRNGFLWTANDGMQDLGAQIIPQAINNRGTAVGADSSSGISRAFRWMNGALTDLNSLLPADSGLLLEEATAINELGWIAGSGQLNGTQHAFLLVPEPASAALLLTGLVFVTRRR